MKLDRNIDGTGRGKYGLIDNRKLTEVLATVSPNLRTVIEEAVAGLEEYGILQWGETGTEHEFFVIKLKDRWAPDALFRYALSARADGFGDYARDVEELADRAAEHPNRKIPD